MTETEITKKEKTEKPSWMKMKPAELEKIVTSLAKEGKSPAQIGLILRDKYGVPKVKLFGKKIAELLNEADMKYMDEKENLDKRVNKLQEHISKNKHDYSAARALTKKLWGIYRVSKQSM